MTNEIEKTEREIFQLVQKLENLRKDNVPVALKNYSFKTLEGSGPLR